MILYYLYIYKNQIVQAKSSCAVEASGGYVWYMAPKNNKGQLPMYAFFLNDKKRKKKEYTLHSSFCFLLLFFGTLTNQ